MLIVRCIGSLIIILSCVLMGYISQLKSKFAAKELENIVLCMEMFNVEVQNKQLNIIDSFKNIYEYASYSNQTIFVDFIKLYNEQMNTNPCDIWNTSLINNSNKLLFSKEELNILAEFGALLGTGDKNIHEINVESLKNSLNLKIAKRYEDVQKKHKAIKTCLYTGILLVIILW